MTLDIKTAEQKDFEELIEAIARELAEVPAKDRGKVYELAIDLANKQKIKAFAGNNHTTKQRHNPKPKKPGC